MTVSTQHSRLGDYELLAKLGEGGMGAVYKARQISLDRIVAIKVLPRRFAADKNYLERFLREARATARLNHPNIVAGIDVSFLDGYYCFVMEFIEAVTLRALIKEKQTLSEREVLRIGALVAGALAHAHKANIIHRDVKPENILIDSNGVPKLTDLGLSKVTEADKQDGYLTQAGLVVGTAYYIAPEQASGDARIDGRADIYSLGCTLYHAATGQPPHEAPTPAVLMVKHISEKMPHPQSINPKLSAEFCDVLSRMVARKPSDRYGSADQAAKDMEQLLAGRAPEREPLTPELLNFHAAPKPSNADIKSAARNSVKKAEPAAKRSLSSTAPARMGRSPAPRQRSAHSWTYIAIIATVALLVMALLLINYGASLSGTDAAATDTRTETSKIAEVSKKTEIESAPKPPSQSVQPVPPPPKLPDGKKAAEPAPRQAPPPLSLNYTPEPKLDLSAMTSLLSDPATDPSWKLHAPKWEFTNGALTGTGQDGNAAIFKRQAFSRDFDAFLSIDSSAFFHFGWQGRVGAGNFIQHLNDGTILISKYENQQSTVLASVPNAAPAGRHDYRVVVQDTRITLYVDGHQVASTNEGAVVPAGQRRDLQLYSGGKAVTTYYKVLCRDLSSSDGDKR